MDNLKKYQEEKLLGKGAFGKAFLVSDKVSGEKFVMKQINIATMKPSERADALREAEILKKFDHPNIVHYREAFSDNRNLFIVMEYANSSDLQNLITKAKQQGKLLEEQTIFYYFTQMMLAMNEVHGQKILHRDIKGQNVFLHQDRSGRMFVKIGDFGVSRVLSATLETAKTQVGTPYYLSPEIASNKGYNNKTDVWSLGCVLYEMCTLNHVFSAPDIKLLLSKILAGKFDPIPAQYSRQLRDLVEAMLTLNPQKRPSVSQILKLSFMQTWQDKLVQQGIITADQMVRKESKRITLTPTNAIQVKKQVFLEEEVDEEKSFGDAPNPVFHDANKLIGDGTSMESKMFQMESLSKHLEQQLGFDMFFMIYQEMNGAVENDKEFDIAKIEGALGPQKSGFLNLFTQLVSVNIQINQNQ